MIQKQADEKYQKLSEKISYKKQEYRGDRYKNLSKNEKQRLVDYRKAYYKMRKNKKFL